MVLAVLSAFNIFLTGGEIAFHSGPPYLFSWSLLL
jgi:hypothetical protein